MWIRDNCYCYTDLTLHNLHCINFLKSLKFIHTMWPTQEQTAVTKYGVNSSQLCLGPVKGTSIWKNALSCLTCMNNRTVNTSHNYRLWPVDCVTSWLAHVFYIVFYPQVFLVKSILVDIFYIKCKANWMQNNSNSYMHNITIKTRERHSTS